MVCVRVLPNIMELPNNGFALCREVENVLCTSYESGHFKKTIIKDGKHG